MSRRMMVVGCLLACVSLGAEAPVEAQIVLQSLRSGERARVDAALGDATQLPMYRGDFTVDVSKRTVSGKFSLTLTAKKVMSEVSLRCTPNAAHAGAVTLSQPKVNGGKVTLNQPEPSLYRLVIEPPVQAGEQVTLELELKAKVPKQATAKGGMGAMLGEGRGGDYGAFSVSDDVVSLVGLMPMLAPVVSGKVVEPPSGIGDLGTAEPSNIVVSVTAPSAWRVVGTGVAMGEVPTGAGQVRFAFGVAAAREMPILLLKNAKVVTRRFGDVEVEATLLGGDASDSEDVLTHAGKAVELLDKKLGPYPFKTLRVVEMRLVNGAGGMEFPGLVTVSATMLSDSANPFEALGLSGDQLAGLQTMMGGAVKGMMKSALEFTIDHEVAHQYTAMLVGSDPIDDPVADEPLTQHLALLILEWRNGKAAADALRDAQVKGSYQMHRMLGGADGKVARPTADFESNREYAALIYGKAPLFFDEARKLVGNDAWERALKTYVEQNRYRFVTGRTFTDLVRKQNGGQSQRLEQLRKRWWEEEHGDEDIGQFDLEKLMGGGMLGGGTGDDKQSAEAFKDFEKAMKALTGE